jgi:hypothetical protein
MAKRNISVRLDPEDDEDFKFNTESNGLTPVKALRQLVKDYNRTQGLQLRRARLDELKAQVAREEDEISRLSLNPVFTFSKQLVKDVDSAIQPVFRSARYGRNELVPREVDYITFTTSRLAKKHQIPEESVRMCMRQRVPELYKDHLEEQNRLLAVLQEQGAHV